MSKLVNPFNKSEIMLIGSNHVSKESEEEIKRTILSYKPQIVMVELDQSVVDGINEQLSQGKPVDLYIGDGSGKRDREQYRKMGLNPPGLDMATAIVTAQKIGARVVAGEENTLEISRKIRWMQSMQKFRVWWALVTGSQIPEIVRNMFVPPKNQEEVRASVMSNGTREAQRELIKYLRTVSPKLQQILIDERDEYMVNLLSGFKQAKVVAVVGLAHVDGMEQKWKEIMTKQNK